MVSNNRRKWAHFWKRTCQKNMFWTWHSIISSWGGATEGQNAANFGFVALLVSKILFSKDPIHLCYWARRINHCQYTCFFFLQEFALWMPLSTLIYLSLKSRNEGYEFIWFFTRGVPRPKYCLPIVFFVTTWELSNRTKLARRLWVNIIRRFTLLRARTT